MNPRRAAVLTTVLAVAVTVVSAALDAPNVGLAALGVAVLGVLGYVVLSTRSLAESVASATRAPRRGPKQPAVDPAVAAEAQDDARRRLKELGRGQVDIRNAIDRAPGLTAEMVRAYDRLVTHSHPMPELGGWAATPSTILWMLDHVMSAPVRTIVECGSGTSTVWLATALERRGGDGLVVALESSDQYAEQTRAQLERLGLGQRATVLHAPLVDTPLPDRASQPWYDVSGLVLPAAIDLLFVDGPRGNIAAQSRYPAFPVLADRLAPGAAVILDDTGRPAEDATLESWTAELHAGRTLEVSQTVDRSTVLVTRTV